MTGPIRPNPPLPPVRPAQDVKSSRSVRSSLEDTKEAETPLIQAPSPPPGGRGGLYYTLKDLSLHITLLKNLNIHKIFLQIENHPKRH